MIKVKWVSVFKMQCKVNRKFFFFMSDTKLA